MNKKGFTLVELLATLVILAIVVGITVTSLSGNFKGTKEKTEGVFVKTIEDALNMYLDTDAKNIKHWTTSPVCTINKTHGARKVYKATDNLTFQDVIDSTYRPITINELVNPANKDSENYQCFKNGNYGTLNVYRDDDYVYYYKINKSDFGCLNTTGDITNLPSGCNG